jgi:hypothetical protein
MIIHNRGELEFSKNSLSEGSLPFLSVRFNDAVNCYTYIASVWVNGYGVLLE